MNECNKYFYLIINKSDIYLVKTMLIVSNNKKFICVSYIGLHNMLYVRHKKVTFGLFRILCAMFKFLNKTLNLTK